MTQIVFADMKALVYLGQHFFGGYQLAVLLEDGRLEKVNRYALNNPNLISIGHHCWPLWEGHMRQLLNALLGRADASPVLQQDGKGGYEPCPYPGAFARMREALNRST